MKTSDWIVTDGSTVEEALQSAMEQLDATEDEIEYVVEEAPRKGWLGLWQWRARIRARRMESAETDTSSPGDVAAPRDAATSGDVSVSGDAETPASEDAPPTQASIRLEDGVVHVVTPEQRMGDPVIRPGPNVSVWVNDQLIDGPVIVTEDDKIRVEADVLPPETVVQVTVADDELSASVSVALHAGARYELRDAPPSMQLTVISERAGEIPAQLPTRSDLKAALAKQGVTYGISNEALDQVLQLLHDNPAEAREPIPVAFGIPMKPTIDEGLELKFEREARVRTEVEEDRADLLGLYKLESVQAGAVLAVKQPGSKGNPGRTVKGRVIPVKEPRVLQVRLGEGAAWDEDGVTVVATRGGRPTIVRNLITVQPQHTVRGDADATTGHIEFDGDVAITGSVGDSLHVLSKGSVTVGNNVSDARVEADESVTVTRGIVRSKVVAGARYARYFQGMAFVQPLAQELRDLIRAVETPTAHPDPAETETAGEPYGSRVKRILDSDFPHLERRIREFHEFVHARAGDDIDRDLIEFAEGLRRSLVGLGPLALTGVDELTSHREQADAFVTEFRELQKASFDVTAGFVDNSEVLAGGQIVLRRGGCSYSRLWAGTGVVIDTGVFRGTSITVDRGDVIVREAGSRTGTPVTIEIINEGRIRATIVHPGVTVAIGNRRHTFRNEERGVRVAFVDGELSVRTGIV